MRISLITMMLADKDSCVHLAHVHNMFPLQVRHRMCQYSVPLNTTHVTAQIRECMHETECFACMHACKTLCLMKCSVW